MRSSTRQKNSADKNDRQGDPEVADFVTIERGLGPEGRIAVVRFDRGDGINVIVGDNFKCVDPAAKKKVRVKEDVTACSSTDESDAKTAQT